MKKLIFLFIAMFVFASSVSAQMSYSEKNAIGLRLGYGAEVSYQRFISSTNRVEVDLGLMGKSLNASGIYQWVWDISSVQGLGWYAGAGVGLGVWDKDFAGSILGQIGLEYAFNIPLSLSLDWKPGVFIGEKTHFGFEGLCLGVRYRF